MYDSSDLIHMYPYVSLLGVTRVLFPVESVEHPA